MTATDAPLSTHTRSKIKRRFEQSLWYAYGYLDAHKEPPYSLSHVDAYKFAQYCENQAIFYYTEVTNSLPSIMDQWREFTK